MAILEKITNIVIFLKIFFFYAGYTTIKAFLEGDVSKYLFRNSVRTDTGPK